MDLNRQVAKLKPAGFCCQWNSRWPFRTFSIISCDGQATSIHFETVWNKRTQLLQSLSNRIMQKHLLLSCDQKLRIFHVKQYRPCTHNMVFISNTLFTWSCLARISHLGGESCLAGICWLLIETHTIFTLCLHEIFIPSSFARMFSSCLDMVGYPVWPGWFCTRNRWDIPPWRGEIDVHTHVIMISFMFDSCYGNWWNPISVDNFYPVPPLSLM